MMMDYPIHWSILYFWVAKIIHTRVFWICWPTDVLHRGQMLGQTSITLATQWKQLEVKDFCHYFQYFWSIFFIQHSL